MRGLNLLCRSQILVFLIVFITSTIIAVIIDPMTNFSVIDNIDQTIVSIANVSNSVNPMESPTVLFAEDE